MREADKGDDLLDFVKDLTDPSTLAVEEDLGHGYVRLRVTEAERRQALQDIRSVEDVVKELVRNARDAGARHILVSFQKERGRWRNICVLDDGGGIPPELHSKIFEARVTSKVKDVVSDHLGIHGRGMALYSIKQVVGEVDLVGSELGRGTVIRARIDTRSVPEKKDQSTFPKLEVNEDGILQVAGGPNNVPRVLTEFVIQDGNVEIYLGSNAEILSTLYHLSSELRKSWAGGREIKGRPLWFELGGIREGKALKAFAWERLGLAVSERNAFRVLEYEIPPLMSINELLRSGADDPCIRRSDLHRPTRADWGEQLARRLTPQDLKVLAARIAEAFETIGDKCWLSTEQPVIKRRKDRLIISLRLHEKED
ncbi:ATP-binding protein [Candidatus Solincola tengchongensis]|uniref:ATP-binding protein n=1 Tax=Candidatus Solincola tengchongensis TaxID=2900693 RepID=UPI00257C3322|nr:ATP-binding protein [Candidatus Solincola tengchongensis]